MGQWQPVAELVEAVQSGRTRATDLVEQSLALIGQHQDYGAVLWPLADRARARATNVDFAVRSGDTVGALAGVPFIAKDNFLVFGGETTAASNMLKGFEAPYQSTVINRLEAAGAICVAKANLDAFAHGSSTENSDYQVTKNPVDATRVPGGSSGGSAAAVALELAPFALGTDTGGSIRLPASFCGVVGYKPTYGLVSRSGIVAMSSSCDVAGPITRNVADSALVLDVISGIDPLDSTTVSRSSELYTSLAPRGLQGKKVGVVSEYMSSNLHHDVRPVIEASLKKLEQAGARLREVSLPSTSLALPAYYVLAPAEVSSNLARHDGQRYPYSYPDAKTLDESYAQSRGLGFGTEAKRRVIIGTYVLSSGYYDDYFKQAQMVRRKIMREHLEAFDGLDLLVGPTAGITAFPIGKLVDDPLQMYLTDMLTVSANLAGLPAVSVPAGKNPEGLPIGLQLMAAPSQDHMLLSAAAQAESVLEYQP
jgi:aspartyl-tRNA(Asn)/glutamyl-tRNA(Gln) amidotransferase subunit A